MKLEPGDVILIDGGHAIVTSVKADKAAIAPLGDLKGRSAHAIKNGVDSNIANNRLLERRGKVGLDEFLAERQTEQRHERKGQLKVELGDRLCYEGALCTVTEVTTSGCVIGHPDGQSWSDSRRLSDFFFRDCACHKLIRLSPEERAANLEDFLKNHKPTEPMKTEKTKTKATKANAAKDNLKGKFTGRSAFTRNLAATTKLTVDEIHAKVKPLYEGASMSTTRKLVESERGKSK
jgi:hypothetical protein